MAGYKNKEDQEKFNKAFAAGSSTGKGAWERLKETAKSAAATLTGEDKEDEKKKKKEDK